MCEEWEEFPDCKNCPRRVSCTWQAILGIILALVLLPWFLLAYWRHTPTEVEFP
jgi:hypothetical protein